MTIDLNYISPVVSRHSLAVFFPAVGETEETGARQGSAVLCDEQSAQQIDRTIATLVRAVR